MATVKIDAAELAELRALRAAIANKPSYPQYQRIDDGEKGTMLRIVWSDKYKDHETHRTAAWKHKASQDYAKACGTAAAMIAAWESEPGFLKPAAKAGTKAKAAVAPVKIYTAEEIAKYSAAK